MARICTMLVVLLAILPGAAVGAEMLRLQAKADELYHDGHWERAYFIYVNDLAAIGDKYSQYMAGYMCLNGRGVERDAITRDDMKRRQEARIQSWLDSIAKALDIEPPPPDMNRAEYDRLVQQIDDYLQQINDR